MQTTTLEDIKKKVNNIIYEVLKDHIDYKDITPEKHLIDDLGVDSTDALEIFLSLMADYDIEMDRKSVIELKNINEIYLYVEKLLRQKEGA